VSETAPIYRRIAGDIFDQADAQIADREGAPGCLPRLAGMHGRRSAGPVRHRERQYGFSSRHSWLCERELLKQWFTPAPYTTPVAELDVRLGGANLVVMRGPDGYEFPNRGYIWESSKTSA